MGYFSTAFARWLSAEGRPSLKELSKASTVPASDLSTIKTNNRQITVKALGKLLPAVEARSSRDEAHELLVAFLRDCTPERYREEIAILVPRAAHQPAAEKLDPLDVALHRWRDRAEKDPEFAEMWLTLDGYIHTTPAATDLAVAEQRKAQDSTDPRQSELEAASAELNTVLRKAGLEPG